MLKTWTSSLDFSFMEFLSHLSIYLCIKYSLVCISLLQSESVPPVTSPSLIKSSEYISPVSLLRSEIRIREREYDVRKPLRRFNDKWHRAQLPGDGGGGGDASLWIDRCHRQVSDIIRMSIELRKEESPGGYFMSRL